MINEKSWIDTQSDQTREFGGFDPNQLEVACEYATLCPRCDIEMAFDHAHYVCPVCHYRDSCCA